MNGFYNCRSANGGGSMWVVIPLRMNGFYNLDRLVLMVIRLVVIPPRISGFYNFDDGRIDELK